MNQEHDPRLQIILQMVKLAKIAGQTGQMPDPPQPQGTPGNQAHHGQAQGRHGSKGPMAGGKASANLAGTLPHQQP
jgi:hypothetical protein